MRQKIFTLMLCFLLLGANSQAQAPCQPSVLFGTLPYNTLPGGVYPFATLPHPAFSAGQYHLTANLTIVADLTITGATILIEPGVSITVNSNAKLILDNCHLFTCPTKIKVW